jgi:hypothetical protein
MGWKRSLGDSRGFGNLRRSFVVNGFDVKGSLKFNKIHLPESP